MSPCVPEKWDTTTLNSTLLALKCLSKHSLSSVYFQYAVIAVLELGASQAGILITCHTSVADSRISALVSALDNDFHTGKEA